MLQFQEYSRVILRVQLERKLDIMLYFQKFLQPKEATVSLDHVKC